MAQPLGNRFLQKGKGFEKGLRLMERVIEQEVNDRHDHQSHQPNEDEHYEKKSGAIKSKRKDQMADKE